MCDIVKYRLQAVALYNLHRSTGCCENFRCNFLRARVFRVACIVDYGVIGKGVLSRRRPLAAYFGGFGRKCGRKFTYIHIQNLLSCLSIVVWHDSAQCVILFWIFGGTNFGFQRVESVPSRLWRCGWNNM